MIHPPVCAAGSSPGMCPRMRLQDFSVQNEASNTSVSAFLKPGVLISDITLQKRCREVGLGVCEVDGISNSSFHCIWWRKSTPSLLGWENSFVTSSGGTAGQDMRQDEGKWLQNVPNDETGHWKNGQALEQALQGSDGAISLEVFKK